MRPHDKFHFVCALGSRVPNWHLCRQRLPLPAGATLVRSVFPCQQVLPLLAAASRWLSAPAPLSLAPHRCPVCCFPLGPWWQPAHRRPVCCFPLTPLPATCTSVPLPATNLIWRRYGGGVGNRCRWADRFAMSEQQSKVAAMENANIYF